MYTNPCFVNMKSYVGNNGESSNSDFVEDSSTSQDVKSTVFIKMAKSRAEINKDYRNKQKAVRGELVVRKPKYKKSKADVNRDYRNRLKAKQAEILPIVPKMKKTRAEISRDYLTRQKSKLLEVSQNALDGELKSAKFNTHSKILKCDSQPLTQNKVIPKNISNAERCKRYRERLKLKTQCLKFNTLLNQKIDSQRSDAYNGEENETIQKENDTCINVLSTYSLAQDPLALEEGHPQMIKIEDNHIQDGNSENLTDSDTDREYQDSDDIAVLKAYLEVNPLALEEDVSQTVEIAENYIEEARVQNLTVDAHVNYLRKHTQSSMHTEIIPKNIKSSSRCKRYRDKLKLKNLDLDVDPLTMPKDVRIKVENNDTENGISEKLINPHMLINHSEPSTQNELKQRNAIHARHCQDNFLFKKRCIELDPLLSQQADSEGITIALNSVDIGTLQVTGTQFDILNSQNFELDPLALEEHAQTINIEFNDTTSEVISLQILPSAQDNFCNTTTQSVIPIKRKVPKIIFDRQKEFREAKSEEKQSQPETETCSNVQRIKTESWPEIEILDERINTNVKNVNITLPYLNFYNHSGSHQDFKNEFTNNTFGHACAVCDRLWWEKDLKMTSQEHENLLQIILPNYVPGTIVPVCFTCKVALDKQKIPVLSTYNGFSYPSIPSHLPMLNFIEQRLISPKVPFMQIRRLRHAKGQDDIFAQILNVPVEVNTMVQLLPRKYYDDHCFYVHFGRRFIHKTTYLRHLVDRRKLKEWLTYLVQTPLYVGHDIKIDRAFLNGEELASRGLTSDISEHVPIEDSLAAQQHTLLWNEDRFLEVLPIRKRSPLSLLFDKYAEELSFPTIYAGQFRAYRHGLNVTSLMQVCSELRRTDRRGVDPQHLLYMAAKIMRQRISQSVSIASKYCSGYDAKFTKENVQSASYINNCIETNFAFLRCVPNSVWYWSDCKKVLHAMIRQLGAPTAFMSLSANETGWTDLLKTLYKLKDNGAEVSDEFLAGMSYMEKAKLVNDDAVTCAIYFSKLVHCLMKILHYKKRSPFGKYRVVDYFKRIEFHRGSPIAHVFLWLDNAPNDLLNNGDDVVRLIDELVSVSESQASGNIEHQVHKHTPACYKRADRKRRKHCRFGAPFMPSRSTVTLIPMTSWDSDFTEESFKRCKAHYRSIKSNLEKFDYADFSEFYAQNSIASEEHYHRILRAGIDRPTLFHRRTPAEKWHNTFNPFVMHHLKSSMNFQIIQDELACAAYVARYASKLNRGIGSLQRRIIRIMEGHPNFHIADVTKKMSSDVLRYVRMSAPEAAWYLLREPVTQSSVLTAYIPTMRPAEREVVRRILFEVNTQDEECTDAWKCNWFYEYEKRPEELSDVTLAEFISKYYLNKKGEYAKREIPRVISYRNYDMNDNFDDYRREMVLLHIPFRSETSVVAEDRYIQIYEGYEELILERRKEFESNFKTEKILQICKQLSRDHEDDNEDEEMEEEAIPVQNYSSLPPQLCSLYS